MRPFKRKGQTTIKLGKKKKEKDLTALAFLIRTVRFHAIFRKIKAFSRFLSRFFLERL
jgi:hypothetical protein